jgi:hypothetical protein
VLIQSEIRSLSEEVHHLFKKIITRKKNKKFEEMVLVKRGRQTEQKL